MNDEPAIADVVQQPTERPAYLYKPGQSGNPAGKQPGTRNRATLILDKIAEDQCGDIVRNLTERAKTDNVAADIVLRRVWPQRKGRVGAPFTMPHLKDADSIVDAYDAALQAVADGLISIEECVAAAAVIKLAADALKIGTLERRLAQLERAAGYDDGADYDLEAEADAATAAEEAADAAAVTGDASDADG